MLDIDNQYLYQEAIGYKYNTANAGWPDNNTDITTTATPKTTETEPGPEETEPEEAEPDTTVTGQTAPLSTGPDEEEPDPRPGKPPVPDMPPRHPRR